MIKTVYTEDHHHKRKINITLKWLTWLSMMVMGCSISQHKQSKYFSTILFFVIYKESGNKPNDENCIYSSLV